MRAEARIAGAPAASKEDAFVLATNRDHRIRAAERLMNDFIAESMGVRSSRYLWTDAFAVCNMLSLHRATGDRRFLDASLELVDQVHQALGRHRDDDRRRTGWISGLSEQEGARHPTCGGLRIGKRTPERTAEEPFDERLEWDRDGQYFHYLTKWMHALSRVALSTGEARYLDSAVELAAAAHRGFVHRDEADGTMRLFWKMSVDLSRPLVSSMGQHDPLDGFVTFSLLEALTGRASNDAALAREREDMRLMCTNGRWATHDELGIGGLLCDAALMAQLVAAGAPADGDLLDRVVADARRSLDFWRAHHRLHAPAEMRLAFRELGLAIGLQSLESMREALEFCPARFVHQEWLLAQVDAMAQRAPIIETIERFWLDPAHQRARSWSVHSGINSTMLATSLAPDVYLRPDLSPAPKGSRSITQENRK